MNYIKSSLFLVVAILIFYVATVFGVTYPRGSEFLILLIAIPIFGVGIKKAKERGLSDVIGELVSGTKVKYFLGLLFFLFTNIFVGFATTGVTKVEGEKYLLRTGIGKSMKYEVISQEEYAKYLRADFRFFSGHFIVFSGVGLLFGAEARKRNA